MDHLTTAIDAAREAGAILLEGYGKVEGLQVKADRSLVTRYDQLSEEVVVSRIRSAFPGHRVLAEEGSEGASTGEYCWVVDPLDGTHNFIRQIGHFGVSIGLVRGDEFVAGVIYLPREDELYAAEKGSGAVRNGEAIHVSRVDDISKATLCFDSSIRYDPVLIPAVLSDIGARVFNLRIFGSSVRTLTHLAEGKVDASLEFDDKPWDFAAGAALVLEAGGEMTTLNGAPLSIRDRGYVASNGLVHQSLRECVASHR